jgi:hypothetical protein
LNRSWFSSTPSNTPVIPFSKSTPSTNPSASPWTPYHLFYDDAGIVRDSQVVLEREWFRRNAGCRPMREACLLTAEGAVLGAELLLMGLFPPG